MNSGKKHTISAMLFFLFLIIFNPETVMSQQSVSIRPNGYTAEKQAGSQTSWLTKRLKLNKSISEAVYKINLKYLLQTDALRLTTTETLNKNGLHGIINQKMQNELKSVLSTEQYNKYLVIFSHTEKKPR